MKTIDDSQDEQKESRGDRVLELMAAAQELFQQKNSGYGEAYIKATDIMHILLPDKSLIQTRFQELLYHNTYAIVTKLLRAYSIIFYSGSEASEDLADSWRDIGVYGFMLEEICHDRTELSTLVQELE